MSEENIEEPGGQEEGAWPQLGAAGSDTGKAGVAMEGDPGAPESPESPEAQESPEPAKNKKSRKPGIIALVILLVACLVGGGIYWFGFRDTTVNQGDSVLTGMENQPKIVPIAGAKDAVVSKEHNGEIIYINDQNIWLWDSNTQKERWRIDNPLPAISGLGKDKVWIIFSSEGHVLIAAQVRNEGETTYENNSLISPNQSLVLSTENGNITAQNDTAVIVNLDDKGQVVACTEYLDLVAYQGKGQMDNPVWTIDKGCYYDGNLSLGFGKDTVRVYKEDEQGAFYAGWGFTLSEIQGEYKLSDGSEVEKGYANVNGYRPPEGGRITGWTKYEALKATMVAYTDAQGRQNIVFINKDGKVLYQAKPGYWFNQFTADKKYAVVLNVDAGLASVVDTATWKEVTQIAALKGFNKLYIQAINNRYVWVNNERTDSEGEEKNLASKLLVYDIKTGKPAPALLAEINTKETTGGLNTFLTTPGFIVHHDTQLTHLREDGSKLWEMKLPEGSFVAKYYKDKKETKPFLAISNSEGVIDSYLK
ncbi:MAG: hypothetical protein E6X32_02070 [Varibaculum cambriense]|uniref:YncE family protein n=1 Tax=Varibaculum cambriense TaxID=184870 RepID=UPI002909238D|nr:hypothetical protein [Varibaculum cambriense]MDU4944384.1 hypothetical protein [Varibaculum cambriense]